MNFEDLRCHNRSHRVIEITGKGVTLAIWRNLTGFIKWKL